MKILEPSSDQESQPDQPHPLRQSLKRRRLLIAGSIFALATLAGVLLTQSGLFVFLPTATAAGVIADAQTGQPLANVPITVQGSSFQTRTTSDAQGHFLLRLPNSRQVMLSVPNYDPQAITPGPALTIKLAPDPGETARRYMQAFMQQNFDQLWSMTYPDAQAFWGSQAALAAFLTRKFGSLPRLSYEVGQANILARWIDPDTTQVYHDAAVLPVSLDLGLPGGILSPPTRQALINGLLNYLIFAEVKSGNLWRVLVAGPLDREAPILAPARAPAITVKVPILMYHHVSAKPTTNALDFGLTVKTADFAAQMDFLANHGYHPITLTDIFDNLYYGMPLPKQPIVLSFDDGYEDNYTGAFPILQQHHFVAEINIITGLIGGWYLTWDQIRQMAAAGMEIGSHTVHHWSLASVLPQTAEQELLNSRDTLEQQLSAPIQFFCYPAGEPFHHGSLERQQFITTLLSQDGYIGALLDPGEESAIQNARYPYQLPRIRVAGGETLAGYIDRLVAQGAGPTGGGPGA